jgi:hypothetical protein
MLVVTICRTRKRLLVCFTVCFFELMSVYASMHDCISTLLSVSACVCLRVRC